MLKKGCFALLFTLMLSTAVFADTAERYQAKSNDLENTVYFDCFNVDGTNYFAIRDVAKLLNNSDYSFNIAYDNENNCVAIDKNDNYISTGAEFNKSIGKKKSKQNPETFDVICDGVQFSLKAYNINDRNYVSLRDICHILGLNTQWNTNTKSIELWYYNDESEKVDVLDITMLPPVIVDKSKPMVALTFDDGPSVNTTRILNTLEKYNGVATFFVTGNNASKYGDTLRRIVDEESQIGNHTYDHLKLTSLSASNIQSQVSRIQNIVYSATGVYPTALRPPYGAYNDFVKANISLRMFNWNVDTLDWKTRNAQSTYNEVINTLADGNVILMHDLYSQTADAVDKIVPEIVAKGYQLVTIDQLCYAKGNIKGQIK